MDFIAALETFRERHGDAADPAFAEVLLDFENELGWLAVQGVIDREGVDSAGRCPSENSTSTTGPMT